MALFRNAGTRGSAQDTGLEEAIQATRSDAGQGQRGKAREERQGALRAALRGDQRLFDITAGEIGGAQGQLREDFLRQRGQTEAGFQPFIDIGTAATEELARGSTPEGLNELFNSIIGGGQFQALQDLQRREAQGQLSASGLGGSGLGVETLSKIGPRLARQLLGDLQGTQQFLSGQGFQGVGQRGQLGNQLFGQQGGLSNELLRLLTGGRENLARRRFSGITGIGEAAAGTREDQLAAEQQRFSDILGLVGSLGGRAVSAGAGAFSPPTTSANPGGLSDSDFLNA